MKNIIAYRISGLLNCHSYGKETAHIKCQGGRRVSEGGPKTRLEIQQLTMSNTFFQRGELRTRQLWACMQNTQSPFEFMPITITY